jgi:hypothetical protein
MGPYIYRARQNIFQFRGCNAKKNCSKIFLFLRSKHQVCLKLLNLNVLVIWGEQSWHNIAARLNNLKFLSPYRKTANAQQTFILSCIMCSDFQVSFHIPILHTNCSFPPVHLPPSPITFQGTIIYVTKLFLNVFLCSSYSQTSFMEAFDGIGQFQPRCNLTRPVL